MPSKASLYDLVEDLVIYRDLEPIDPRLPRFAEIASRNGLPTAPRPRKHELAYAQVVASLLRHARALDRRDTQITELVYLGDTAMSDGNAFRNLRTAGRWPGWAFIGAERDQALAISETDGVYVANRWSAVAGFIAWMLDHEHAALGECTAVIVDVDKTALGARGRNDGAIDRARVTAIEVTVAEALGPTFDQAAFRRAYVALNTAKYHPFTADNQDYVAYVCLMVSSGFVALDDLLADLAGGAPATFREFIDRAQAARLRLPSAGLRDLHDDIYARVCADDPTPFKAFRRREYRETVNRMGRLPDDAPLAQRLLDEICLTQEIVELANWLRRRGCLLMALSDKPDEATAPTPALVAQGYLPLHRTSTHIVGQSIAAALPA